MRLSNERYEEIKQTIAEFMEDRDVRTLPIDLYALINKMNIKIKKASAYANRQKFIEDRKLNELPNGYCLYSTTRQRHVIYLDDVETGINRQRFSMAHEIMHIILGHIVQSDENESEADFGAAYLLAPHCLVFIAREILNYDVYEYGYLFGISPEYTAPSVKDMFANRLLVSHSRPICDYEIIIINLLKESFLEKLDIVINSKSLSLESTTNRTKVNIKIKGY